MPVTYEVLVMAEQSKPSWADHLFPVGLHYYAGVVESAEELMERNKVATQCSFGKKSSTKKAHPCQLGPRKLKEKKKRTKNWHSYRMLLHLESL